MSTDQVVIPTNMDTAERCVNCSALTMRLDGDGEAKWCCRCGARLNGEYVTVQFGTPDKPAPGVHGEFMESMRQELLAHGRVTPGFLDYMEDRINTVVSDKLSQCMGDLEEQLLEKLRVKE